MDDGNVSTPDAAASPTTGGDGSATSTNEGWTNGQVAYLLLSVALGLGVVYDHYHKRRIAHWFGQWRGWVEPKLLRNARRREFGMTRFFLVIGGGLVEFGIVGLIWYVAGYLDQNYEVDRGAVYMVALLFVVVAVVAFALLVLWLDIPLSPTLKLPRVVCRDNDGEEWRWTSRTNQELPAYGVTKQSQNAQRQDGSELQQFFASWRDRVESFNGLIIPQGAVLFLHLVFFLIFGLLGSADERDGELTDDQLHALLLGAVWASFFLFPMLDVIKRNVWGLSQWREYNMHDARSAAWDTFCSPSTKRTSEAIMHGFNIIFRATSLSVIIYIVISKKMTHPVIFGTWLFGAVALCLSLLYDLGCVVVILIGRWKEEWQFVPDNELPDASSRSRPPNPNPPQVPPARSSSWGSGYSADQGSSWFSSSGPSGPPPPQPPRQ